MKGVACITIVGQVYTVPKVQTYGAGDRYAYFDVKVEHGSQYTVLHCGMKIGREDDPFGMLKIRRFVAIVGNLRQKNKVKNDPHAGQFYVVEVNNIMYLPSEAAS